MTFQEEFLQAMLHLVSAPFREASVLWQLIPILLVLFVLGGYFILWHEELGWNSALTNALTLFWVVMTSMQVIFGNDELFSVVKFVTFSLITVYTIFLLVIVFAHRFSDKVTFIIASPLLIHYTGMIVILWAHGLIIFDPMVVLAMIVLFVILNLIHVVLGKIFGKELEEDMFAKMNLTDPTLQQPSMNAVQNSAPLPMNAPTNQPQAPVRLYQPTYRQQQPMQVRRTL